MKRTFTIAEIAAVTMVAVAALVVTILLCPSKDTRVTVSFSPAHVEITNGTSMRVTFEVTNTAGRTVYLQVAAIQRQGASGWVADTNTLPTGMWDPLGNVGAQRTIRVTYEMPYRPMRTRLQVLVAPQATPVQKAQFALRRLWADVRYRRHYTQFWFGDSLAIPSYRVLTPEFQ